MNVKLHRPTLPLLLAAAALAQETRLSLRANYSEALALTAAAAEAQSAFDLDTASAVTITVASASPTMEVTLVDPSGAIHAADKTDAIVTSAFTIAAPQGKGQSRVFAMTNPPPGRWLYRVRETAAITGPRAAIFYLMSDSTLAIALLGAARDYPLNRALNLAVLVADTGGGIGPPQAQVTGSVALPSGTGVALTFHDDGLNGDATAGDGIFTASFTPSAVGSHAVLVKAAGTRNGQRFQRSADSSFKVMQACGTLGRRFGSRTVDSNRNGRPDFLELSFDVTAQRAAQFSLTAYLTAGAGKIAYTAQQDLTSGGKTMLVQAPVEALRELGVNGPYQVAEATLACAEANGDFPVADRQTDLGATVAFDLGAAELAATAAGGKIALTGKLTDNGVDSNANGLFDSLSVGVEVEAVTSGDYAYSATLKGAQGNAIGYVSGTAELGGRTTLQLTFDGQKIGKSASDGPYTVADLALSGAQEGGFFASAGKTKAYTFDKFEGAPARAGLPRPAYGGIADAASYRGILTRGGLASLFGADLAGATDEAKALPLPRTLGGVRVTVGSTDAPLVYVAPGQINFQVPFDVPEEGQVQIVVTRGTVASPPLTATVAKYAPGVFTYASAAGTIDPVAVHPDGSVVTAANPALPGEVLVVYATGFGALDNPPATGAGTPDSPYARPKDPVTVTLGGANVEVLFAGLTPRYVGLAQLNLRLPATLPEGSPLPLVVEIGATVSAATQLAMRTAAPGVGPRPAFSLARLDFGDVAAGATKDLAVTLRNSGDARLDVTTAAFSNPAFRLLTPALPFSVAAGGQQDLTVRFTPPAAGTQSGTLTVSSNASNQPVATVALTGSGETASPRQQASIEVTPARLDFGPAQVGQSRELTLVVRNTGTASLTVSRVSSGNAAFAAVSPVAPFAVAAGGSQSLAVRFTPTAAGAQAGTLAISSNAANQPSLTVALAGTGEGGTVTPPPTPAPSAARITVTPERLDFGSLGIGQSKDLSLTVSAAGGTAALTVSSVSSSNAQFTLANQTVPFTTGFGGTANLTIRFKPSAMGAQSATLNLTSNAANQPNLTIPLTGTGAVAGPQDAVLQIDDGSFERMVGYPGWNSEAFWVNRLTPPQYPAKLTRIQIYFPAEGDIAPNTQINLVLGTHPSGTGTEDVIVPRMRPAYGRVPQVGRWMDFDVTLDAIESGDFIVGLSATVNGGLKPMAQDTSRSAGRSYVSKDGTTYEKAGKIGQDGNFLIRAVVRVGQ